MIGGTQKGVYEMLMFQIILTVILTVILGTAASFWPIILVNREVEALEEETSNLSFEDRFWSFHLKLHGIIVLWAVVVLVMFAVICATMPLWAMPLYVFTCCINDGLIVRIYSRGGAPGKE